jgi:hypothetical protein
VLTICSPCRTGMLLLHCIDETLLIFLCICTSGGQKRPLTVEQLAVIAQNREAALRARKAKQVPRTSSPPKADDQAGAAFTDQAAPLTPPTAAAGAQSSGTPHSVNYVFSIHVIHALMLSLVYCVKGLSSVNSIGVDPSIGTLTMCLLAQSWHTWRLWCGYSNCLADPMVFTRVGRAHVRHYGLHTCCCHLFAVSQ